MIFKCANPNCCKPFLHLREGALFLFEKNYSSESPVDTEGMGIRHHKEPRRLENFWLCADCSSRLVVRMIHGKAEVVAQGGRANPSLNMHAGAVDSLVQEDSRVVVQT